MPEVPPGRRPVYFSFQGLFMAVLLLIFFTEFGLAPGWRGKFTFLTLLLGGSLVFLQMASERLLANWFCQVGLFLSDAALASLVMGWTHQASELYLIYCLVIFGTALMRDLAQSLIVAVATSSLYLYSAWGSDHGAGFLLRLNFLWVSSALLAILSRDSRQAQREVERRHRDRMIRYEKLAALGQLAGEVAHRIKGPLTTIMVNAEVLAQRAGRAPQEQRELTEIRDEVVHCREILKSLLDLGRIEEMDDSRFDLREPLQRALEAVAPRLRRQRVRLQILLAGPLPVRGDAVLLQEALAAVLHNAGDAVEHGGRIRVSARVVPGRLSWRRLAWSPRLCEVVVEDDGRGIRAEDLERVFEPFFTTKGRSGSGLGLSAALRVFQKHEGSIEAFSDGPGRGARFVLTLPLRP